MFLKEGLEKKRREVKAAFHVPGHRFGRIVESSWQMGLLDYDFTEIDGTDNLHHAEGIIKESQQRVARIYGSDHCRFLVNGTTGGILSAIYAHLLPGHKVLLPREVHKSVINALEISGAIPVFIRQPMLATGLIYAPVRPEDVEEAILSQPDVRMLFLTYPNYYGHCFDIKKTVAIAHKYDKIVVVDSAHGSHFMMSHRFPQCAVDAGADIVIQSTHKTLLGMTQSSWLHVKNGRVDLTSLDRALAMFQSSSPSYVLMTSLDITAGIVECDGMSLADSLVKLVDDFKEWGSDQGIGFLEDALVNDKGLTPGENPIHDPTRINLDAYSLGMSGYELGQALQDRGIYTEMHTQRTVVLVATIASIGSDFVLLKQALQDIIGKRSGEDLQARIDSYQEMDMKLAGAYEDQNRAIYVNEGTLSPQEVRRRSYEHLPLDAALGRIVRTQIVPYPPGVPVCLPGMPLDAGIIRMIRRYLEEGHEVHGIIEEIGQHLVEVVKA